MGHIHDQLDNRQGLGAHALGRMNSEFDIEVINAEAVLVVLISWCIGKLPWPHPQSDSEGHAIGLVTSILRNVPMLLSNTNSLTPILF
jgi:hypothetical protein